MGQLNQFVLPTSKLTAALEEIRVHLTKLTDIPGQLLFASVGYAVDGPKLPDSSECIACWLDWEPYVAFSNTVQPLIHWETVTVKLRVYFNHDAIDDPLGLLRQTFLEYVIRSFEEDINEDDPRVFQFSTPGVRLPTPMQVSYVHDPQIVAPYYLSTIMIPMEVHRNG